MRGTLPAALGASASGPARRQGCRRLVAVRAVAGAVQAPVRQPVGALPVREHHGELRQRVVDSLPQGGVVYLEGGKEVPRNGADVFYDFRPDSNFFYLTGCSEPGFAAVIDTTSGKFTLLSARVPEEMLHWVGALPSLEELAEEYGADACAYYEDAPALLRASGATAVHSLPGMVGRDALRAIEGLQLSPTDALLEGVLARCRESKTDSEVACLQHANNISSDAHFAVMRASRQASWEYELESVFLRTTRHAGLKHMGYPAIIGAGRNAAVLHYGRNDCLIRPGDAVLMDAGAEYRCYTADITRTFPAARNFTAEMADVYDAVLAVQELALAKFKAGAYWQEVTMDCRRLLASLLLDLGLARGSVDGIIEASIDKLFMPHGLGHFLGLDVHDFGGSGLPVPDKLMPRHVVTCEPGIYFVESLLGPALADSAKAAMLNADRIHKMMDMGGVRIEDNVAILEDGEVLNLTNVPKARADVEAIVASS